MEVAVPIYHKGARLTSLPRKFTTVSISSFPNFHYECSNIYIYIMNWFLIWRWGFLYMSIILQMLFDWKCSNTFPMHLELSIDLCILPQYEKLTLVQSWLLRLLTEFDLTRCYSDCWIERKSVFFRLAFKFKSGWLSINFQNIIWKILGSGGLNC